jgi:hypothetical protein
MFNDKFSFYRNRLILLRKTVFQERQDPTDSQELKGKTDRRDLQDQLALPDHRDLQVHKVKQDLRVPLVLWVLPAKMYKVK